MRRLHIYIKEHPNESMEMIDEHFVFKREFLEIFGSALDYFLDILKNFDYTTSIMKKKVDDYLTILDTQSRRGLNSVLFIPFKVEYGRTGSLEPVYDVSGSRQYEPRISGYHHYPSITNVPDRPKMKRVRWLLNDFFFYREFLLDRVPKECRDLIMAFAKNGCYISFGDLCLHELRKIGENDRKPKFVTDRPRYTDND